MCTLDEGKLTYFISFRYKNCNYIMLNLDKIGPDWNLAQNHAKACRPGRPVKAKEPASSTSISMENPRNQLCECCLNIIHKEDVSLLNNSK